VVPAHSFKYAATLQKAASKDNPVLIRIETKSGHGASNVTKQIEATADIYAFIMHHAEGGNELGPRLRRTGGRTFSSRSAQRPPHARPQAERPSQNSSFTDSCT